MFTTGRIIFSLVFLVIFIGGLIWSFRRDKAVNKFHYSQVYKIVLGLLLFVLALFLIVKLKKYL